MKKATNCIEDIDINFGLVVLKFKKLNVSEVTIAREPCRGNERFVLVMFGHKKKAGYYYYPIFFYAFIE